MATDFPNLRGPIHVDGVFTLIRLTKKKHYDKQSHDNHWDPTGQIPWSNFTNAVCDAFVPMVADLILLE